MKLLLLSFLCHCDFGLIFLMLNFQILFTCFSVSDV